MTIGRCPTINWAASDKINKQIGGLKKNSPRHVQNTCSRLIHFVRTMYFVVLVVDGNNVFLDPCQLISTQTVNGHHQCVNRLNFPFLSFLIRYSFSLIDFFSVFYPPPPVRCFFLFLLPRRYCTRLSIWYRAPNPKAPRLRARALVPPPPPKIT